MALAGVCVSLEVLAPWLDLEEVPSTPESYSFASILHMSLDVVKDQGELHTLLEENLKGDCFVVGVATDRVVCLRVRNHQFEVSFKCEPVLVFTGSEFGAHCAEIHR